SPASTDATHRFLLRATAVPTSTPTNAARPLLKRPRIMFLANPSDGSRWLWLTTQTRRSPAKYARNIAIKAATEGRIKDRIALILRSNVKVTGDRQARPQGAYVVGRPCPLPS